ncbi:hypothetical protein BYT27DRAFT_7228002 [Phlegmacium glaucopus]|nr:hypothetical protein BYT27DRAFT_7228002 [Phlegmacium glaucopus]
MYARPGVSLDKVTDTLAVEQLSHIASQLKSILAQLRSVKSSKMLGSVSGRPYRNKFFPPYVTPKYAFSSSLSRIPRNAAIQFTHDWATGGFYPAYWEYCRMHDPAFATTGWRRVLQEVFPGEPCETEIDAACQMLFAVVNTIG